MDIPSFLKLLSSRYHIPFCSFELTPLQDKKNRVFCNDSKCIWVLIRYSTHNNISFGALLKLAKKGCLYAWQILDSDKFRNGWHYDRNYSTHFPTSFGDSLAKENEAINEMMVYLYFPSLEREKSRKS